MKGKKGPDRDPAAVRRFVERFAGALVDAGMPRMASLVFVTLLTDDEGRLTADDLVARLDVSRAAVSGAVQYLTHVGMLRRERPAGARRDHYLLTDGDWFEVVARREKVLDDWIAAARSGVDVLGPRSPAGERLAQSAEFFEFMQSELAGMLERWREHVARSRRG